MNTIDLLKQDMEKHVVSVTLPGETEPQDLFLIEVTAKVRMLDDIRTTYGDRALSTHAKLVVAAFGNDERDMVYGVFVDKQGTMVFAFNRLFADYDYETGTVVYQDLDDLLVAHSVHKKPATPRVDLAEVVKRTIENMPNPSRPMRSRCTGGRISYSLPDKTKP